MSDKIKPSEVSQVLLEQLNGISDNAQFDEAYDEKRYAYAQYAYND